jgi:hypothetical protein
VVDLVYRYPTTLAQGLVWYESLNLVGDGDVQMMFDMFMTCKRLGISTMEVYAGLMDASCDETHVEPPYIEPTPSSYPHSIPSSYPFIETQTSHNSMPSSSAHRPSESTHNIDLNSSFPLDNQNDSVRVSVVAGVHDEEVGDFSENEDDILA